MDANKSTELANLNDMTHDELVEIVKKSLKAQKWLKLQIKDLQDEKNEIASKLASINSLQPTDANSDTSQSSINQSDTRSSTTHDHFDNNDIYNNIKYQKTLLEEELQFLKQELANRDLRLLELKDYRTFVQDLEEQVKCLRVQIENQTQSIAEITEQRKAVCDERENLSEQLLEAKRYNSEMENSTEVLQNTIVTLKSELKCVQTSFSNSSEVIDKLSSEIEDLKEQVANRDVLRNERISNLQEDLKLKNDEIENMTNAHKSQMQKIQLLESELYNEREQQTIYKKKVAEALKKQDSSSDDKKLLTIQNDKLKAANIECSNLRYKLERSESKISKLMLDLENYKTLLMKCESQLNDTIEDLQNIKQNHLAEIEKLRTNHHQIVEKIQTELQQCKLIDTQLRQMNKELIESSGKSLSELKLKEQEIVTLRNELNVSKMKAYDFELKADRLDNVLKVLQQSATKTSMQPTNHIDEMNKTFAVTDLHSILETDYNRIPAYKVLFHENVESDDFKEIQTENVRLKELVATLKLDVRRLEDRGMWQKHVPNTEYLKNVLLKLFSSTDNEEKSVLVNVVAKILSLSEEENQNVKNFFSTSYFWPL